jgi:hypothetical protein
VTRPGPAELRSRLGAAFKGRLSPEHTHRATQFERMTVPTLVFLVARSAVGFARWRFQRELWRRDVERFGAL